MSEERHWLVRPRTIRALWLVFAAVLAATVLVEFATRMHGEFDLDESFGFNAWFGFASCVALVLVAKLLGLLVKRRDTYYDRKG
jgi:hypothetical protein